MAKKRLTRKQKRELGILPIQVLAGVRELIKEGDIERGLSPKEMAFVYISHLADDQEYGDAWDRQMDGTYGVDFDVIMEWVQKILEILMLILPLFV